MLKGVYTGFLLLSLFVSDALSQQLSHQVLVPAAGIAVGGGFSYSQTIGETAVEIISDPDFVFTQGFQQPALKASSELLPEGNGVLVYPNPVAKVLYVKLFGDTYRKFTIELINITGVIISTINLGFNGSYYHIEQIDATKIRPGSYFVRVISDDHLINRTFRIVRIDTE